MKYITFLLLFVSTCLSAQNYRPDYHYTPPKNWVNDPNGLVYLDGEYHLFYQYNPEGTTWGHMSWAHAVSRDLKQWETLPLALPEYKNSDGSTTMIFSGCVVIDANNTSGFFKKGFTKGMVAVYTSHIEGKAQHQSLAYSADNGRTWTYHNQNPVLDIGLRDFRDPNVIWYAERQVWLMTVSKPLAYTVQFYESKDLKKWNLLSEFGKKGDTSRIWECPSLTKVPIEGSTKSKWVLMISSGHRQKDYLAMQYFVGDFDGKNFISQPQSEVFYVNEGKDFYAAIPFNNLPASQPQPIIMGWLNDWEYAPMIPTGTYRGGFSVPIKLSLYDDNSTYKLKQEPIIKASIPTEHMALRSPQAIVSSLAKSNQKSYRLSLKINVLNAKGFDLHLLKNETESTVLSYNVATTMLAFDRTKSGNVDFHKRFSSIEQVLIKPENGILKLDILVDKSVIEVFVNNGKLVLTDLVFPLKDTSDIEIVWR